MMQPVGEHAALLYATLEDLRERGTTPEALDLEQALELVREGADLAGLELEAPLELEAYPDRGGVLLFVRSLAPRRVWHPFLELEALLDAARDLGPLCAAAEVVWFGGLCCLTLPAEARQARRRLSGFASPPEDARGLGGPGPGGRQRPALRPGPGPAFGRFQGEIGIKAVESGQNTS